MADTKVNRTLTVIAAAILVTLAALPQSGWLVRMQLGATFAGSQAERLASSQQSSSVRNDF
jgi:hypothetical protein